MMWPLPERRGRRSAGKGGREGVGVRLSSERLDGVLELLVGNRAERPLRCPLMRTVSAVECLPVVEDGLVQNGVARPGSALPRDAAVGMECSAEAAENGEDRKKRQRQADPDACVTTRPPGGETQELPQEPDQKRREQDGAQETRSEMILLHRRSEDRGFVVLQAIEKHDVVALMEDLIIGDAGDEEQRHHSDGKAAERPMNAAGRPCA